MPRKDLFHEIAKHALIADGWQITHDPLHAKFGSAEIYVDLGAERLLGAEKEGLFIAVEVKSFVGASWLTDFHLAVGQFMNYRLVLQKTDPQRTLYLALPEDIYYSLFETPFGQAARESYGLKLIVVDDLEEVITKWIG